jgi:transposase-like protein
MIDCFDGLVVSWTIGTRPDANLVSTMLDAAIETVASGGDHLSFTSIVAPTIAGPGGTHECKTKLRQSKYPYNIVEQDHRAVKRITNPKLGFKSFWSAQKLIAGIETMHMIKKRQLHCPGGQAMSAAEQFYSLAF